MTGTHRHVWGAVVLMTIAVGACSAMEPSGTAAKPSGKPASASSQNTEGFVEQLAAFGAKMTVAVGNAFEEAARAEQRAAKAPRNTAPASRSIPGSMDISWQVETESQGIKNINGTAPPDLDLTSPQIAARAYLEGCRIGGGGNSYFGDINIFQNGRLTAKGNLRGCDAGGPGNNFSFNQAAVEQARDNERRAHAQARESHQQIGNIGSLPSDLQKEMNAAVVKTKARQDCREGCKDFAILCSAPDRIDEADRANGISDARFVGIKWLRFGVPAHFGTYAFSQNSEKSWHLEKHLLHYLKKNGQWVGTTKGAMYDVDGVCGRRRF